MHSKYEIHAEQNAIIYALNSKATLQDSSIYVSMEPCLECAKLLLISGIKKVYYVDNYKDKRFDEYSSNFLESMGIKVKQISL